MSIKNPYFWGLCMWGKSSNFARFFEKDRYEKDYRDIGFCAAVRGAGVGAGGV